MILRDRLLASFMNDVQTLIYQPYKHKDANRSSRTPKGVKARADSTHVAYVKLLIYNVCTRTTKIKANIFSGQINNSYKFAAA
jgi:hypothetical protein